MSDLLYPLDSYLLLLETGNQLLVSGFSPQMTLDGGHLIPILEFD